MSDYENLITQYWSDPDYSAIPNDNEDEEDGDEDSSFNIFLCLPNRLQTSQEPRL